MRGRDKNTISQTMKFGYFHPNQRSAAKPGSQSQRDNAVTMRPPSSIPTGVRLNRLRKYPNQASAMKSGASVISPKALQTNAPKLPRMGPPIPTCASIHALRGASLSAMNAPMNGMKTGAPTFNPMRLAASKWPHSWTKISSTKPSAYHQPQVCAYSQRVRNIVPPVFNNTGKNFSTGISSALNFNSKTPRTPRGTKAFFNFCPLPECGGLGVTTGGRAWCGGESINQVQRSHGFISPQVSFPARAGKGCWVPMNRGIGARLCRFSHPFLVLGPTLF